jgi:hypothetical protein
MRVHTVSSFVDFFIGFRKKSGASFLLPDGSDSAGIYQVLTSPSNASIAWARAERNSPGQRRTA